MSDSLKEQLLGLGFKPAPKPAPKPAAGKPASRRDDRAPLGEARHDVRRDGGRPSGPKSAAGKPRTQEEIDLGKAYALRAETEKRERIAAELAKQEAARLRREAKARLDAVLAGKGLNDPSAEHARHFPYGGKIKRVHVTPDQLKALNHGELGVVQSHGRYLLVTAAVLAQAKAIFPDAVALEVDPDAPAGSDAYADPQYQVPDDLVW